MKKTRKTVLSVIILSAMILFTGCYDSKKTVKDMYISFTVTQSTEEKNQFEMNTYCINLTDNKKEKVSVIPYTSQYPLTLYRKEENKVYYTAIAKDGKGDEVYVYDCSTGKKRKLTKNLFAVNYLFPIKDGIFIGAAGKGSATTVRPYIYHTKSGKMEDLTWDKDFFISCAGYDPFSRKVYMAGYSEKKAMSVADEANNGITNSIYELNEGKIKKIKEEKDCYMQAITAHSDLIYKSGNQLFDSKDSIYKYSFKSKNKEQIKVSEKLMREIEEIVFLDQKEIYCICSRTDSKGNDISQLCKINLDTMKKTLLFETRGESKINNAQVQVEE